MEYKRILCPVDFSDISTRVLQISADLAKRFGADLHVIHVFQLPATMLEAVYEDPTDMEEEIRQRLNDKLNEFVQKTKKPDVKITTGVYEGVPDVEIITSARENQADMIVMGTRGKTGLSHVLLGSVAERVIRNAEVPVMTVRK
ncbi:MAG TPA: universal stress protein [Gammaproteobacteria bacterium]